MAGLSGLAFSSAISETKKMFSNRESRPSPVFAETSTDITSPPQSSTRRFCSLNCRLTRSGSAPGKSILLIATIMGTSAALAWLMASRVCGIKPSSAATTSIAISVTRAPRDRMAVKASWPGVSRNVAICPPASIW